MEKTTVLDNLVDSINFENLPQGSFFHYKDSLYLKVETMYAMGQGDEVNASEEVNAIKIETGNGVVFDELQEVTLVKKIIVAE